MKGYIRPTPADRIGQDPATNGPSQSVGERLRMSYQSPLGEATATDDSPDEPASFSSAVSGVGSRQLAPDPENSRRDSSISYIE
ncbi:hypothetical protein [Paraburkholderia tuberum]|uniref:hypothetical protein n=1 Tax=Paraburkholderia tuberum TaxID=157910 RepID=UPI00115F852D|nr:hypothetical protein [Paraburkholderia tuberum]